MVWLPNEKESHFYALTSLGPYGVVQLFGYELDFSFQLSFCTVYLLIVYLLLIYLLIQINYLLTSQLSSQEGACVV